MTWSVEAVLDSFPRSSALCRRNQRSRYSANAQRLSCSGGSPLPAPTSHWPERGSWMTDDANR
jgi:hypothetical protein